MIDEMFRLWRTLAPLRFSQWYWRLRYALERRRSVTMPNWAPPGAVVPVFQELIPVPLAEDTHLKVAPSVTGTELQILFLQVERQLSWTDDPVETWRLNEVTKDRLGTVSLHYHRWLFELLRLDKQGGHQANSARKTAELALDSWLSHCHLNIPNARALVWNSYAIATRLGWWARCWKLYDGALPFLEDQWKISACQQARWLYSHIEWDLRGNHLLRDAVGLAWAGRCFEGPEAQRWLAKATILADGQVAEQILADGGHFERSPMYHIDAMEDVAVLWSLIINQEVRLRLASAWSRMAEWASWMRHSDGSIALFDDAACNGCPSPSAVLQMGSALGLTVLSEIPKGGRLFPNSGFIAWHGQTWDIFIDVGHMGPLCQPGHAHADALTMEASWNGDRLIVDPGVFGYDLDDRRKYDRSTSAHNTVTIDDADSAEVWHIFRCGRRAHIELHHFQATIEELTAVATHDGYRHLPGSPCHQRVISATKNQLHITDTITGTGIYNIEGGWLLHPDWQVADHENGWNLTSPSGSQIYFSIPNNYTHVGIVKKISRSPWHPGFGIEVMTNRISWRCAGATLPIKIICMFEQR